MSQELQLLAEVTEAIVDGLPLDGALEAVLDGATRHLNARRASIMLVDRAHLHIAASRGIPRHVVDEVRIPMGEGIAGEVAARGEARLLRDLDEEALRPGDRRRGYRDRSAICVPLRVRGETIGVLCLNDREEGAFDEAALLRAKMIANQAALVLHVSRLTEDALEKDRVQHALDELRGDERKARERLAALELVSLVSEKLVARSPDLDEVLDSLIERVTDLVGARRGSIMIHDPEAGALRIRAARGIPEEVVRKVSIRPGQGLSGRVFESGEAVLVEDFDRAGPGVDRSGGRYATSSAMVIPLATDERTLGVVNISDKEGDEAFSEDDFFLCRLVSHQASIAIRHARLSGEWLASQRLRRSLEVAREVQRSLLPRTAVEFPGVDVALWTEACEYIGGDYVDLRLLDEDRLAVIVADVSGHGIEAALTMATTRAFVLTELTEVLDGATTDRAPSRILQRVSDRVDADTGDSTFVTFFLGILDVRAGRLTYASAGHDEPLHWRAADGRIVSLRSTGLPLGLIGGATYESVTVELASGDLLLFTTDGVWEAMTSEGEAWGRERLIATALERARAPVEEIVSSVRVRLVDFVGGDSFIDDVSLLALRVD